MTPHRFDSAILRYDPIDQFGRRDIKNRILDPEPLRNAPRTGGLPDFLSTPVFNRNRMIRIPAPVDRGSRSDHHHMRTTNPGELGQHMRTHFVGNPPIGTDSICTDDEPVEIMAEQSVTGNRFGHELGGDPVAYEFIGRKPRPLQPRPCLGAGHTACTAFPEGLSNHSKGRPLTNRREPTRIAVCEDSGPGVEMRCTCLSHSSRGLDFETHQAVGGSQEFPCDLIRVRADRDLPTPFDQRPVEINRSGP